MRPFTGLISVVILALMGVIPVFSQSVPHPYINKGVYDFLDELASAQLIDINSAVKPYSRMLIAEKLREAEGQAEKLNPRQREELEFYLRDFGKEVENGAGEERRNGTKAQACPDDGGRRGRKGEEETGLSEGPPLGGQGVERRKGEEVMFLKQVPGKRPDLFYYKDSLFSITVNPIIGGELFTNSDGQATYWRNGVEARAYAGKWGFYASLRDNHEKPLLGKPAYLTQREGGHLKGSTDWSEMRGGVTWDWGWGNAGLIKDGFTWGTSYNGANIFGGRNPSFIRMNLEIYPVKWFRFNWFHGWLNSMVVDSAASYYVTNSYGTDYREVYHRKFISANMFTFTPMKHLNISAGNSIIYDSPSVNPAFVVPLFFYKSVDHSVSSGIDNMNSQMFFDISSRQLRNLHLYATLFVDELSVARFTMDDEWNFFSWKAGFRLSNFPVDNLSVTSEFTYTYPLTFQHYVPTLTFESNNFNLGHYLKDNSREWYLALNYRPLRTLDVCLWLSDAIRGPDYTELGTERVGNPPLASKEWQNTSFGLRGSYQVINDLYLWLSACRSEIKGETTWTPGYYFGGRNTFNLGISLGF